METSELFLGSIFPDFGHFWLQKILDVTVQHLCLQVIQLHFYIVAVYCFSLESQLTPHGFSNIKSNWGISRWFPITVYLLFGHSVMSVLICWSGTAGPCSCCTDLTPILTTLHLFSRALFVFVWRRRWRMKCRFPHQLWLLWHLLWIFVLFRR